VIYVLDTDICSYLMKRTHPVLIDRVKGFEPGDLKVSVVTVFELPRPRSARPQNPQSPPHLRRNLGRPFGG
jgi:predicted nucleic acid-binding protein